MSLVRTGPHWESDAPWAWGRQRSGAHADNRQNYPEHETPLLTAVIRSYARKANQLSPNVDHGA